MSNQGHGRNFNRERGLIELYGTDPERADAIVFGRKMPLGRRGFLKGMGLSSLGAALGATIIEKHFTLKKNLVEPDQKTSISGYELKNIVKGIRIRSLSD